MENEERVGRKNNELTKTEKESIKKRLSGHR